MSKEKLLEQAEKYAKDGKLDKAIKELQKLVATDPLDMRVRLKVADYYVKKKEIPLALKTYQEVADFYAKENFHLKSIAVYKTILKLNPSIVEINEKLGDLYRQVGLDDDAVNQYYIVAGYYDNKGMTLQAAGFGSPSSCKLPGKQTNPSPNITRRPNCSPPERIARD